MEKTQPDSLIILKVIVAIVVIVFLVRMCGTSDDTKDNQQKAQPKVDSPTVYITKDGHIAATSEEYLDEAYMYVRDNDLAALDKLIKMKAAFLLKPNIEVIIVDGTLLGKRKAEFRIKGDRNTFWAVREAFSILTEEEYNQMKLKLPKD
jgi:hypothetical protein